MNRPARRPFHYILDANGIALPVFDLDQWAEWMGSHSRIVARDEFDGYLVSTVFLWLDHCFSFCSDADPLLFETMVFTDGDDMWRYSTRLEALAGHERVRQMLAHDLAQAAKTSHAAIQSALAGVLLPGGAQLLVKGPPA